MNSLRDLRQKRGVVVVIVVVLLVVLIGFATLAIDVGFMYSVAAKRQKSVDAGALAGISVMFDELGLNEALATAVAKEYVFLNGPDNVLTNVVMGEFFEGQFFQTNVPENVNAIKVTANRYEDLFFANIFGVAKTNIGATAIAGRFHLSGACLVPVGLRSPGFGPVDPDIAEANPGKDGPSYPSNDSHFQIGEEVVLFIFGKGPRSPVHLVLDLPQFNGVAETDEILSGDSDRGCELVSLGDEMPIWNNGTGNGNFGNKLEDRLEDESKDNDTIICPVLEILIDSRDDRGRLTGNVEIVDFVAVHLDGVMERDVPDPNKEDKEITVRMLVGTVVLKQSGGIITEDINNASSVFMTRLLQ